jgi:serine/threonine protein kinase
MLLINQRLLKIFSQLVVSVSLFDTQQLVHHDLKPGNIFIDEELNAIVGASLLFLFFICMFLLA